VARVSVGLGRPEWKESRWTAADDLLRLPKTCVPVQSDVGNCTYPTIQAGKEQCAGDQMQWVSVEQPWLDVL
jgi:hypothetical protein